MQDGTYNETMAHRFTRRYFLRLTLGSAATVGLSALGGAGYATFVEPHWLLLKRVDVPIPDLPATLNGFTIAQLSDLHRGPVVTQACIARAVELALWQETNLVVLTGDYVSGSADYAHSCAEALAPLATSSGAIACLGNHDHWTDADIVARALTDVGITVLRNSSQEVTGGLWVAAVDDVWERHADLGRALQAVPSDALVVLLAHEPDYADEVAATVAGRVGLQLSGHSHGGQVRLPLVGAVITRSPLPREYASGVFEIAETPFHINNGLGTGKWTGFRFLCPPEATLIELAGREHDRGADRS